MATVELPVRNDLSGKKQAFIENAALISEGFGIIPLMYGSLGLEFLTGEDLGADDVDILIPGSFLTDGWPEFREFLENNGYELVDEHEHEFEKDGARFAYARIEELEPFAGIDLTRIGVASHGGVRFMLLSLEQYKKVYAASSQDGYRINTRGKKDAEKLAFIESRLRDGG